MQIDIDFDVFKAITARREREEQTANDVLRDLLGLSSEPCQTRDKSVLDSTAGGVIAAGRPLPAGTQLKTVYKGKPYSAEIANSRVVSQGGKSFSSLSAAAFSITGSNVNGLRFWKAKRPGDVDWSTVATLPTLDS